MIFFVAVITITLLLTATKVTITFLTTEKRSSVQAPTEVQLEAWDVAFNDVYDWTHPDETAVQAVETADRIALYVESPRNNKGRCHYCGMHLMLRASQQRGYCFGCMRHKVSSEDYYRKLEAMPKITKQAKLERLKSLMGDCPRCRVGTLTAGRCNQCPYEEPPSAAYIHRPLIPTQVRELEWMEHD